MKKPGILTRVKMAWGTLRAGSMGVQLPPGDDSWYASRGYQTATGIRVSPESAMRVAAVFSCVRVVAETIASLPLIIYKRLPNGGKQRAIDHPLYSLLHDSPNAWQTAFEFVEMLQSHLELRGNSYALIQSGGGNPIDALIPLHPDRVIVKRLSSGQLQYSVRDFYGGNIQIYTQDEMLHIRSMSSDGLVGMSTISIGAEAIAAGLATQEYASRFFENDATPPTAFMHPASLSADAYARLKTSLAEAHGGPNHHKPIVLEENMTVKSLGVKPSDSQLLDSRQFSRGDIASLFRVPPHKIGDLTKATFSNIEEQNIEFATDCIRPRLERLEQRISKSLIEPLGYGEPGEYFCEFLIEALMRGDQESRYKAYAIGRNWGWLSANDVRTLENMNPIVGGDTYLSPLNMTGVGDDDPDAEDEGDDQEDATAVGDGTGAMRLTQFVNAAAERCVRKEIRALNKIAAKKLDADRTRREVSAFYGSHVDFLTEIMQLAADSAEAYCISHQSLAQANIYELVSEIERAGAHALITLAMPALRGSRKIHELPQEQREPIQIHVEPHIHLPAQPAISFPPIEVRVSQESAPKPARNVTAKRLPSGAFEFTEVQQPESIRTGTVRRNGNGEISVLMGAEDRD